MLNLTVRVSLFQGVDHRKRRLMSSPRYLILVEKGQRWSMSIGNHGMIPLPKVGTSRKLGEFLGNDGEHRLKPIYWLVRFGYIVNEINNG